MYWILQTLGGGGGGGWWQEKEMKEMKQKEKKKCISDNIRACWLIYVLTSFCMYLQLGIQL